MALVSTHVDRDDLGRGQFRDTIAMKRVAYWEGGSLHRHVNDWIAGDATFPHAILTSSMLVYWAQGAVRICPTRDPAKYIEMGRPLVKPAATWQNLALAAPTRSGNKLVSVNANYNVELAMGGHFLNCWDVAFKGGYTFPNSQVAFRVGLSGLTRSGANILDNGVVVAHLTAPHVIDLTNSEDVRPVAWEFVQLSGNWYALLTLPSLAGMTSPYLDPTLTLQPDATDGKDASIDSGLTNFNSGVRTIIDTGAPNAVSTRRGLLQFTLSAIPGGSTVSSAVLTLTNGFTDDSSNNRTMQVYRVLRAWVEGTRNYANDAPPTGATWTRYDTTNNWGTAGCSNIINDREAISIGSTGWVNGEAIGTTHNFALTASAVQGWVSGALTNNGILMQMETENTDLFYPASSDNATAGYRPKLVVVYTLGGGGIFNVPFQAPFRGAFG